LSERELADGRVEQRLQVHQRDELVALPAVRVGLDAVDRAQEIEGLHDGEIPPELRPLPEDDADVAHVARAVPPGDPAHHLAAPGLGDEDPGQDLDRRGLAGAVRADVADQLALPDAEADPVQRADLAGPAPREPPDRAPGPGPTLRHAERLDQVLGDDLGHGVPFPSARRAWLAKLGGGSGWRLRASLVLRFRCSAGFSASMAGRANDERRRASESGH
jgi:hypothetical protein